MGSFSIWHWLIVLLVVTLIFGTRKLRSLGSDLGGAVKDFRESVRSDEKPFQQDNKNDHIIEGEITHKIHSNT